MGATFGPSNLDLAAHMKLTHTQAGTRCRLNIIRTLDRRNILVRNEYQVNVKIENRRIEVNA